MTRTVYLNGDYLPEAEAKVSIFDRGFVMADGVYEVTSVLQGKLLDFPGHLARLSRSLTELGMGNPLSDEEWLAIHRKLVDLRGNAVNYPAIRTVGITPNHGMRRAYELLEGKAK